MSLILLDTSFVLALELPCDQYHDRAVRYSAGHSLASTPLLTTTLIAAEAIAFLQSRGWHDKAVRVGHLLMESPRISPVQAEPTLVGEAWLYLKRHRDKRYSLADCLSFLLMEQLEVESALTFDRHFAQAGFRMLP